MVDVYAASAMPTKYPLKLQKPSTISDRVRETAETFIMDSGIGDDVSNAEVLELAEKHNADFVVAKDYLHDQLGTTESIRAFWELYNDFDISAEALIPLQPPFDEHYIELKKRGLDHSHHVLGGMALDEISTTDQLKWIKDFNQVAPDVYTHGLGVGGGIEFIEKVAGTDLLDSVDCATPEMAGQFGAVLDERLRQQQVRVMNGEGASKRNIPLSEFNSFQLQDVWERECKAQTNLSGYG